MTNADFPLMARVNSLIRRYTTLNPTSAMDIDCLKLKGMVIDKANRIVSVNDMPAELTSKEFDLLIALILKMLEKGETEEVIELLKETRTKKNNEE